MFDLCTILVVLLPLSFRMKRKYFSWEECMNLREVKASILGEVIRFSNLALTSIPRSHCKSWAIPTWSSWRRWFVKIIHFTLCSNSWRRTFINWSRTGSFDDVWLGLIPCWTSILAGTNHFRRTSIATYSIKSSRDSLSCTSTDSSIETSSRRICFAWDQIWSRSPTLVWPEKSDRSHRTQTMCRHDGIGHPKCYSAPPTTIHQSTFGLWAASWPSCTHCSPSSRGAVKSIKSSASPRL